MRFLFGKCGDLMLADDPVTVRQSVSECSALDHTMALSAETKHSLALDYAMLLRPLHNFVMETLVASLRSAAHADHGPEPRRGQARRRRRR